MQVTINNKVNAQIIYGPANHTYVNPISPFIRYHWDITGELAATYSGLNDANKALDEKADIVWDWNAPEHKIVITEYPIYDVGMFPSFDPNRYKEVADPSNNAPPHDLLIQSKIDEVADYIMANGGTGVVQLAAGTYEITEIHLAEGVRIVGQGIGNTILKRDASANNAAYNKMLTTYWYKSQLNEMHFSFLASSEFNSKPIQISKLTIDGNRTILDGIGYADAYQQTALINLWCPYRLPETPASKKVVGPNTISPYTEYTDVAPYLSTGAGKLKVFIDDCHFINSGGDAVLAQANVDLTMINCKGTDIYRGTYTITGGANKAKLKGIITETSQTVPKTLTKSIDFEVESNRGYLNANDFRVWLDVCNFDKNVQFQIRNGAKLLLTGTNVNAPPTSIDGPLGGDMVANNCTFAFSPVFNGEPNTILAPTHLKFNKCTLNFMGNLMLDPNLNPPPPPMPNGCYNGLYFTNHVNPNYYANSHIGFNDCHFNNMNGNYTPSHPIYVFNSATNGDAADVNHPNNLQLFFKACTKSITMTQGPDFAAVYSDGPCPNIPNNIPFELGVINNNLEYTGGESEDEMKEHFGVRAFDFSQDPCDFPLVADPNIQTLINPTATALIVPPQGANINGRKFIIEGSLTIDQNMSFTNCTFYMKASSMINVAANKTLTLSGCTLQAACKEMWSGMYASDPTAQIFMDNCTMQEAENGLSLINNAKGTITENHFINNHENIQIFGNTDAANCTITQNDFTFAGGLLAPYVGEKPLHGIYIDNCSYVDIGHPNDATSGNHFSNIWNGVTTNIHQYTTGEFPFQQINIYGYSKIQLFNNEFIDINQDLYVNAMNQYDEVGTAVYGHRHDPFYELRVNVSNTLPVATNPTESIENCYIGIWLRNASGTIDRQKIKSGNFGFVATECEGKRIRVADNKFEGTYFNILKSGDETTNGFYAINNTITHPFDALMQYLVPLPPVGIASTYSSMLHVGKSNILNNSVTMPLGNAGIGISLSEGSVDNIFSNQIHMTTPNVEFAGIPKMLGIYSNNCTGVNFIDNTVDNGGGGIYVQTKSAGIYLNKNANSYLKCNNLNYTKMGVFAVGQNGNVSDYDRTVGNYMNNSDANLMLWYLTEEGSMGQVGVDLLLPPYTKYDADNTYNDPHDINPLMTQALYNKVFRLTACSAALNFLEGITTTFAKLEPSESSASAGAGVCDVDVNNPATFTTTFTCPPGGNNGAATTTLPMDYHYAIAVATGQIDYTEFLEGARRANEELVQQWLASNDSVRNSNPTLATFYTSMNSQIVGQLNAVETQISALNDSTLRSTPIEWMTAYNTARTLNNNLGDSLVFEQNAKYMNNLYLNTLLRGRDTLNAEQQEDIEALAFTCPFVGGNAVYRARVLHGMRHWGIHYDDLELCNGQGVYKNGNNRLQQQLNQLQEYANNKKGKLERVLVENEIVVYPNPATTEITIEYNIDKGEVADFVIFDMLGRESLRTKLYGNVLYTKVSTITLLPGIYLYKISKGNGSSFTGKLTIE